MVAEHRRDVVITVSLVVPETSTEKAARQAKEAMEKIRRASEKLAKAQERAQKQAQENIRREQEKTVASYQNYVNKVKMGQAQIAERMNTALADTTRMARGLAMMGIAGEESTEKLLRGLIKIQAYVDVIGGSIGLFIRLTRVMRDYSEMTKAAALANNALAAAQAKAGATGAARALAGQGAMMAGGIGGMAAGAAMGGAKILAVIGAVAIALDALAQSAAAAERGLRRLSGDKGPGPIEEAHGTARMEMSQWMLRNIPGFKDFTKSSFGRQVSTQLSTQLSGGAGQDYWPAQHQLLESRERGKKRFDAQTRLEEMRTARDVLYQQQFQIQEVQRVSRLRPPTLSEATARTQQTRAAFAEAGDTDSEVKRNLLLKDHLGALREQFKLQEQYKNKVMEANAAQLKGAQEYQRALQAQQKQHEANAKALRQQAMSVAERIGAMDPIERARLSQAIGRERVGTATQRDEARIMQHAVEGGKTSTDIRTRQRGRVAGDVNVQFLLDEIRKAAAREEGRGVQAGRAGTRISTDIQQLRQHADAAGAREGGKIAALIREYDAVRDRTSDKILDVVRMEIQGLERRLLNRTVAQKQLVEVF